MNFSIELGKGKKALWIFLAVAATIAVVLLAFWGLSHAAPVEPAAQTCPVEAQQYTWVLQEFTAQQQASAFHFMNQLPADAQPYIIVLYSTNVGSRLGIVYRVRK